jgi:hypothetical protein
MKINNILEMLTQLDPNYISRNVAKFWKKSGKDSKARKKFKYKKRGIYKKKPKKSGG